MVGWILGCPYNISAGDGRLFATGVVRRKSSARFGSFLVSAHFNRIFFTVPTILSVNPLLWA